MSEPAILEILRARHPNWKGPGHRTRCPSPRHKRGDVNPSLSVNVCEAGSVLLRCVAGCDFEEVLKLLECTVKDLYPKSVEASPESRGVETETRNYIRDDDGIVGAVKVRADLSNGSKTFRPEGPLATKSSGTLSSKSLPLFGSERISAFPRDTVRVIVEGEQSANALLGVGILALGTVTGASTCPSVEVLSILDGSTVILWPDNDDIGRQHMREIAAVIGSRAAVSFVEWKDAPPKGDAKDFVERLAEAGRTPEEIRKAVVAFLTTPTKPEHQEPRLALSTLDQFEVEVLRWLWGGRIPLNKLTLIAGDPGLGKSLLTVDVAARVTTGRPMPGDSAEEATQGDVLIFAAEDDNADTIRPRIEAAGGDSSRIRVIDARPGKHPGATTWLQLDQHLGLIEAALEEFPEVRVIIIDPVTGHLGDVDAHKDADMRPLLTRLAVLAQSRNVAILMIAHLNKASDKQAMYRPGGSIALVAVPRAAWLVGMHPKDDTRRVFVSIKGNLSANTNGLGLTWSIQTDDDGRPVIRWEDEPFTMTAQELLEASTKGASKLQDACAFLTEQLANGKQRSADIDAKAKKAGINARTLRRARDELFVRAKQFMGVWWLIPPAEDPECQDASQATVGRDEASDDKLSTGSLLFGTTDDDDARDDASAGSEGATQ